MINHPAGRTRSTADASQPRGTGLSGSRGPFQKMGSIQPLEGLHLYRASLPLEPVHSVVKPSFCVIAQGSKEVLLGDSRYRYDPSHYLIATVELPRVSQVLEASQERPYLSLRLELDPTLVGSVMVEAGHPRRQTMPM